MTTTDPTAARASLQRVTALQRWTPMLWSLRIDRPEGFRFAPGHYAKLGLDGPDGQTVWRPYSIVSAVDDPELEFLIVLIPGGAFSEPLSRIEVGQTIQLASALFGFFLEPQLAPGDTLWMLATGTGLGPYVSLLRTSGALDRYQRLIVVHSVRLAAELTYRDELQALAASDARLSYLPIVTREAGAAPLGGRIPALIADGTLAQHAQSPLDPATGRVMVCGNPDFTTDMRALLNARGFVPCRRGNAGSMLFEKYW
ncbi:ferredoxin--NADP reductase [Methyloversatilis sp.]|uniref:ferredoxin--NADP reductase n=1 Tax=Methyloversatilis sp. TaxID=2569862 RepID=UPI0027333398|nr:ferredoxin--NADP reductase [Methyloversatilis sp.]MDP2870718.1 ferredoxin--NADP reductase [Methyloversatilis sp.]MDP3287792.1 ferredoxin--NADP reductase [Methyloversatilis sp.]MDP3455854.1 ferredoxin--NADP reductase [Methyloversatilis sp.]MDP3578846.1 ferredoxin--NADP reductase [Methyloversatilis sp.]